MIRYHARWVLPVNAPPIRDGWVVVDRGRIVALGRRAGATDAMREVDLGHVAILPGLVNAHTHLELSYLRDEVPPASTFVTWVRGVIGARRGQPDPEAPVILAALDRAIADATAFGTAVVGDITNTLVTFAPLVKSELAGVVFYELIKFRTDDPAAFVDRALADVDRLTTTERVRVSLAPHAPYSVAPLVFRAIRHAVERDPFAPTSVHLSESVEEMQFVRSADGPWRAFLE